MKLIRIWPVIRTQSTNTPCVILDSSKAIQTIWGGFKITDFKFSRRQNRFWTTPGASLLNVHCSIGNDLTERFVHLKSIEWFVNRTWAVGKNVSEAFLETKNHFGIVFRNKKSFRKRFLKHKIVSETICRNEKLFQKRFSLPKGFQSTKSFVCFKNHVNSCWNNECSN